MTKQQVDLNKYADFVDGVTSTESKDFTALIERLHKLHDMGMNVPRLLTGGIGLAAEGGEFDEIVKKMIFQGKDYTPENKHHLIRELGDIGWYWVQACIALDVDPNEVINENVRKLESRFPGGKFNVWHSENRMIGDI